MGAAVGELVGPAVFKELAAVRSDGPAPGRDPGIFYFGEGAELFRSERGDIEPDLSDYNDAFFMRRGAGRLVVSRSGGDGRVGAEPSVNATLPAPPAVCLALVTGAERGADAAGSRPS